MEETLLAVHALAKSFVTGSDSLEVLHDIHLTIPRNSVSAIIGASGCGKTTLLRILAGLESPSSGQVITNLRLPSRALGYLPQGEKLLPWRTVTNNVSLGRELLGERSESSRSLARELLSGVGLEGFLDAYPYEISGGMTQRALIARTLSTNPELLLLDEPLSQLDIPGRRDLVQVLRNYVLRTNAALILVTHSIEEAILLADYIYVISQRPAVIAKAFSLSNTINQPPRDRAIPLRREDAFQTVLDSLIENASVQNGEGR